MESFCSSHHAQTYHNIIKEIVDKGIVFFASNSTYYGYINYFSTENK